MPLELHAPVPLSHFGLMVVAVYIFLFSVLCATKNISDTVSQQRVLQSLGLSPKPGASFKAYIQTKAMMSYSPPNDSKFESVLEVENFKAKKMEKKESEEGRRLLVFLAFLPQ